MNKHKHNKKVSYLKLSPLVLALVLFLGLLGQRFVTADHFESQIGQLQQDNQQKQTALEALGVEAASLQEAVNGLQQQIAILEGQIAANQAKSEELQNQIKLAEEELAKQKRLLGQNIKAMYLEGDITTVEMLASSKDLSEFVDNMQYRDVVKDKIKSTLDKITALKLELKKQKDQLEVLIADQKVNQTHLNAQRAEQARLLSLNSAQRAEVDQQIKNNAAEISELRRQQAIENARLFSGNSPQGIPGGGGYPWGDAICLSTGQGGSYCPDYGWGYPNSEYDPYSYVYRNCTSWVAYRVASSGRYIPAYLGNARQWPGSASARGYSVDRNPRVGDAAVNPNGYYGHVMYVEAVNGDGSVTISQYNGAGDGNYSVANLSAATISSFGIQFIHF